MRTYKLIGSTPGTEKRLLLNSKGAFREIAEHHISSLYFTKKFNKDVNKMPI